jgi:Papain-like cysteine protease AvrRpt2
VTLDTALRHFKVVFLTVLCVASLAAIPAIARTQAPLPDIRELAPNVYVAGIPTNEFKFVAARQHAGNWCWAAAIQMVLNYDGLAVSQEQIVARVFGGSIPDAPAEPEDILDALSGWAPQFNGRPAEILATPYIYQPNDIVGDLANHWPILVGLRNPEGRGHVFVLTAVTYSLDSTNQPVFRTAVLRDPSPAHQSRIQIPWNYFSSRVDFFARVRVHRM